MFWKTKLDNENRLVLWERNIVHSFIHNFIHSFILQEFLSQIRIKTNFCFNSFSNKNQQLLEFELKSFLLMSDQNSFTSGSDPDHQVSAQRCVGNPSHVVSPFAVFGFSVLHFSVSGWFYVSRSSCSVFPSRTAALGGSAASDIILLQLLQYLLSLYLLQQSRYLLLYLCNIYYHFMIKIIKCFSLQKLQKQTLKSSWFHNQTFVLPLNFPLICMY